MTQNLLSLFFVPLLLATGAHAEETYHHHVDPTEFNLGFIEAFQGGGNSSGGLVEYLPQYTIEAGKSSASFGLDLGWTSFKNQDSSYFSILQYGAFETFRFGRHFGLRVSSGAQTWSNSFAGNGTAVYIQPGLEYRFGSSDHRVFEGLFVYYTEVFQERPARMIAAGLTLHWPSPRRAIAEEVAAVPLPPAPMAPPISVSPLASVPVPEAEPTPSPAVVPSVEVIPVVDASKREPSESGEDIAAIKSGAFNVGSAYVGTVYTAKLQQVAEVLKTHPAVKLKVEGHTDNGEVETRKPEVGQKRADRVREILIGAGASGEQITAVGVGSARPVDPSDTDEARARNRRVELIVEK